MPCKSIKSRYTKTYYYTHRKHVLQYLATKVKCDCGATVSRGNLHCHRQSMKHQKYLRNLNQTKTPVGQTD